MPFNKSNNPDFKSESYSIKLHRQSLSQRSNAIVESLTDTDSLRVILRFPSFQLFQTEETLRCIWTILPRGVNKSSFGHLQNKKSSIKDENTAFFSTYKTIFSILTDQRVYSRFLECKCSPLQTANQRMFEVCSHKSTFQSGRHY